MRREPGGDDATAWIVVADVFVAFLAILFLLLVIRIPELRPPPPAPAKFAADLEEDPDVVSRKVVVETPKPEQVRIVYRAGLLFPRCEWSFLQGGDDMLARHARTLTPYARDVSHVQIEGHADRRPAQNCGSLRRTGLNPTNWTLSSLRALKVRDTFENTLRAIPEAPEQLINAVEAVGRGDLHPISRDIDDDRNRRIEITVHFKERGDMVAKTPPSGTSPAIEVPSTGVQTK